MKSPLPDTQATRNAILGGLRRYASDAPLKPLPDLQAFHAGPYSRGRLGERPDPAALIQPFIQAARAWRAEVLEADTASWPQAVRQALAQRGCRQVLVGRRSELQSELEAALGDLDLRRYDAALQTWKQELFGQMQASVTSTAAGIADTGSLVLWPGPDEPRTLSLVPPVHVAVLFASRLYASLPAAMAALQPTSRMPTNLLLVTGPSKTADIQQVLAYGAHGPKELIIVLVNDLAPAARGAL